MADRALPTVLVVGASRGIGLELARAYAPHARVFGTVRDATSPGELARVPGVSVRSLDVRNSTQLAALAREFDAKTIDLLVHSAGVNRGAYDEQPNPFRRGCTDNFGEVFCPRSFPPPAWEIELSSADRRTANQLQAATRASPSAAQRTSATQAAAVELDGHGSPQQQQGIMPPV